MIQEILSLRYEGSQIKKINAHLNGAFFFSRSDFLKTKLLKIEFFFQIYVNISNARFFVSKS